MADRKLFSRLHRKLLYTCICEWLVSLVISHASAKHQCEHAHVSNALPTCESKLASAKLENTCEYSQINTRVLAIVLASTRNRTCQHSRVLAIFVGVSHNRINKLWCTCGMAIRGKLVLEHALSWLYYNKYVCLCHSLQMKYLKKKNQKINNRPPAR